MSSVLQVENINVYYGSIHAVKDVSFHVEQGEVVTLIGANGAGKSTTLNTVAGLLRSRTGSVRFMDEELRHVPSHKLVGRGMALVPEGRRIFQHMTVQENLDMGGYCRSGDLNADIESVYERFPRLKERRKQVAGTLSGGEQQMLAMGRALMSHPKLLMLDEPSMGLRRCWWSRYSTSFDSCTPTAPLFFWWSRTHRRRWRWPTGAMCWKRGASSRRAPARRCWRATPSRRHIWADKRMKKTGGCRSFFTPLDIRKLYRLTGIYASQGQSGRV